MPYGIVMWNKDARRPGHIRALALCDFRSLKPEICSFLVRQLKLLQRCACSVQGMCESIFELVNMAPRRSGAAFANLPRSFHPVRQLVGANFMEVRCCWRSQLVL